MNLRPADRVEPPMPVAVRRRCYRPTGSAMRALSRLLLATTLCVPLAACKHDGAKTTGPGGANVEAPARKPGMPRPYKVPAKPELALHVAAPAQLIDVGAAHVPGVPDARALVRQTLGRYGDFERALGDYVDLDRSWDAALVSGQLVAQIPLTDAGVAQVKGLLADKAPAGKFGAVNLGTTGPGPKLAWLDEQTKLLTLADDERGLATGADVAAAFASKPVFFTTDAAQAQKYGAIVPFQSIAVSGSGTDALDIRIEGVAAEHLARLGDIEAGALTGLVESRHLAAAVTTRYAHADRDVKSIMSRGQRQVDQVPFFVKGNAEDLLRRAGAFLRSWNGSVMVGVGPKQHLYIGLGSDDARKTGLAFNHLMNGVMSNLSLAKTFGVGVPKLRYAKNKSETSGVTISALALEGARKYVPSEYHALLNGDGDLRIAIAFVNRTGAMMIVAGPGCVSAMQNWIEDIKTATPAADSRGDYLASSVALDANVVRTLLAGTMRPEQLLQLDAGRAPSTVVVRRKDADFDIAIRGPKLTGAPPAPSSTPTRTNTKPAAPTRAKKSFSPTPSRAPARKPIR